MSLFDDMRDSFQSLFTDFSPVRQFPVVDVKQTEKEYIVEAELPGMKNDDVDVRIDGRVLSISGETETSKEEEGTDFIRRERRSQSFTRKFNLPDDVDEGKVKATFDNGLLTVALPRTNVESSSGRKIKIDTK
jgi:HSP20 family protein